jgi:hypothetical protein
MWVMDRPVINEGYKISSPYSRGSVMFTYGLYPLDETPGRFLRNPELVTTNRFYCLSDEDDKPKYFYANMNHKDPNDKYHLETSNPFSGLTIDGESEENNQWNYSYTNLDKEDPYNYVTRHWHSYCDHACFMEWDLVSGYRVLSGTHSMWVRGSVPKKPFDKSLDMAQELGFKDLETPGNMPLAMKVYNKVYVLLRRPHNGVCDSDCCKKYYCEEPARQDFYWTSPIYSYNLVHELCFWCLQNAHGGIEVDITQEQNDLVAYGEYSGSNSAECENYTSAEHIL